MMKALKEAKRLWNEPQPMIDNWSIQLDKIATEEEIALIAGKVSTVADCGCGSARMFAQLDCRFYYGYDSSLAMLAAAKTFCASVNSTKLYQLINVDILSFQQVDISYDLALLYDVAIHYNDPIATVKRWMELWRADRYLFSILVGDEREDLYASTICSYSEADCFAQELGSRLLEVRKRATKEKFAWWLLEVGAQ